MYGKDRHGCVGAVRKGHGHSKDMKKSAKVAPAAAAGGKQSKPDKHASAVGAADSSSGSHIAGVPQLPTRLSKVAREETAQSATSGSASGPERKSSSLGRKSYLSKSHDNLTSSLRRKAAAANRQRPVSWVGEQNTLDSAAAASEPSQASDSDCAGNPSAAPAAQRSSKSVNFACGSAEPSRTESQGDACAAGDERESPSNAGAASCAHSISNPCDGSGSMPSGSAKSLQSKACDSGVQSLLRPTASSLQKSSGKQQAREIAVQPGGSAPARPASSIPRLTQSPAAAIASGLSASSSAAVSSGYRCSPANSVSSLSSASAVIKKSSSIQNLTRHSQSVLRRVSSTHNVGGGRGDGGRRARAATALASSSGSSASQLGGLAGAAQVPSSAVAYNVELLASFEKEKRVLEGRISGLVQITENRKAEIEKYKIEVRNLRKRLPSREVVDELEKTLNENRLLRDRLHELGVSVEQITDSEKLSMLSSVTRQRSARASSVDNLFEVDDLDMASSRHPTGSLIAAASSRKSDSSGNLLDDADYAAFEHGTPDHPSILSASCSSAVPSGGVCNPTAATAYADPVGRACIVAMDNAWEKQSNKSSDGNSEISVACLQDRILQMEETHYSTNEELQATLQELGDLQQSVNQLTEENEHLTAEKSVLLQSLCAQTEKLENARTQIEHLKALVLSDMSTMISSSTALGGSGDGLSAPTARESQLAGLLRSAQEEREELVLRQQQLNTALATAERNAREARAALAHALADNGRLVEEQRNLLAAAERQRALEEQPAVKAAAEDKHGAPSEMQAVVGERLSCCCKTLQGVQNSKADGSSSGPQPPAFGDDLKCGSDSAVIAAECTRGGLTEAAAAAARVEKEQLEQHVASLQEALSLSQQEAALLREQHAVLEEDLKLLREDDKACLISELEFKCEQASADSATLRSTCEQLRNDLEHARKDAARHLEEARTNKLAVSDLQAELKGAKHRYVEFEKEMKALSQRHEEEAGEWRQFQSDLQIAVVIANAIKTETEEALSRSTEENKKLRLQIEDGQKQLAQLQQELDRLKWQKTGSNAGGSATAAAAGAGSASSSSIVPTVPVSTDAKSRNYIATTDSSAPSVSSAVPLRRLSEIKASQSASVKSLIKTIEGQSVLSLAVSPEDAVSGCQLLRRMSSIESSGSSSSAVTGVVHLSSPSATGAIVVNGGSNAKVTAAQASAATAMTLMDLQPPARPSSERRTSIPNTGEVLLKSALKKPATSENADKKSRQSSFSYEKSGSPIVEPESKLSLFSRVSESDKSAENKKDGSLAKDPLANLVKLTGGSKRNALLKWCQQRTVGYRSVDVTNFSSSWNDGLAFCALLHGYMPDKIPYDDLVSSHDKKRNFTVAFQAAESVGIYSSLNVSDMVCMERPDWQSVMLYVTDIYKHFEFDGTFLGP